MVQEQFCFREESTNMSMKGSEVALTRRKPACDTASINVTLSFVVNGTTMSKFIQSVVSHLALDSTYTLIIYLQISQQLAILAGNQL